jgi:hypothetical protein
MVCFDEGLLFDSTRVGSQWLLAFLSLNVSCTGDRDQEDRSSKPAQANSLGDPILKKTLHKKGLVD